VERSDPDNVYPMCHGEAVCHHLRAHEDDVHSLRDDIVKTSGEVGSVSMGMRESIPL